MDIGYEGNYEYKEGIKLYRDEKKLKTCLSNDKRYLAISNIKGRLFIYNTKNFKN